MKLLVWSPLTLVLVLVLSCPAQPLPAVTMPDAKTEAAVFCSEELYLASIQPNPYGFAKATLASLWFARNAAETAKDIQQAAKETDNMLSFSTALMRITKTSTSDFTCAKRALKLFIDINPKVDPDGYMKTASGFMSVVYDSHIHINLRMIEVIKRLQKSSDMTDFMDQISTLQVERSERWADLVKPASIGVILLVAADDKGTTTRLNISKAQKKALFDWTNEHFPELNGDQTSKGKLTDPAKTAQMMLNLLNGRRGFDE